MMEDNSAHFFEGTEKLLEVWFSRQDETKGTGDLRTIPRLVSLPSPFASSGVACGGRLPPTPPTSLSRAEPSRVPGATAPLHSTHVNMLERHRVSVELFCFPFNVSLNFSNRMDLR